LLSVGVLRLARQFDEAGELLKRLQASTPADWQAAWANEKAALAWHRGQVQEASALWQKQPLSIPVLFNRGMAALFLGNAADARPLLSKAVDQLSGEDGWHHLGRLYLTLAEMR
jgi:tetratricopeptide (TPR) repeat protein